MSQEIIKEKTLERSLGLLQATGLVVGSVIGSGIFISAAGMARILPSGGQLIGVWMLAGLMTLFGALTQAELCSRMPLTGGLYTYFRVIFGDALAFFYGWANFMIAGSGAIAAIAFIFSSYLGEFVPLWQASKVWQEWAVSIPYLGTLYPATNLGEKLVGSTLILLLTALNARGVKLGARLQLASVTAKILAILIIVGVAFIFSSHGSWQHLSAENAKSLSASSLIGLWFVALGGAFWSYDGWGNVAYVGGEIKNPQKNLPRAILLGISLVVIIYLIVNSAYIYVLSLQQIGQAPGDRVASAVMSTMFNSHGVALVAALIMLSTFDTVNSSILTNARVYFAMANDKLFLRQAGLVDSRRGTPAVSLWLQGAWSIVLLISGSFDLISSMYIFVNWLFYLLIPIALFILRKKSKNEVGNYFKVPFYPVLPIIFALFTAAFLIQTLIADIHDYQTNAQPCVKSLMGLALVLCGTPFYLRINANNKRSIQQHKEDRHS